MYVIKINNKGYYTGRYFTPIDRRIKQAKHYLNKHRAEIDATKVFSSHKYINQVVVVEDERGIQENANNNG